MGIESHNADFFVITQTTPEQVFYSAPGRSREISRKVDRDVFHRGLLLTILTAPITQSPSGLFTVSKLYQNPISSGLLKMLNWRKQIPQVVNKTKHRNEGM
jgi:hypothetical protein